MSDPNRSQDWGSDVSEALRLRWIARTQVLLNSFKRLLGRELIERSGDDADEAARIFHAKFAVLSHGTEADPVLDYGNRYTLDLWEMPPETFIQTPSRLTAEPIARAAREILLEQTRRQGYLTGYQGVRISATGRRFYIENVTIWNLFDDRGAPAGQAATFGHWSPVS